MDRYYLEVDNDPLNQETPSVTAEGFYFSLKTKSSVFQVNVPLNFPNSSEYNTWTLRNAPGSYQYIQSNPGCYKKYSESDSVSP